MSALERVMRAYTRKYKVNEAQSELVRTEISKFIQELSKDGAAQECIKDHRSPVSTAATPKAKD